MKYLTELRQALSRHQWAVPVFLLALLAMIMLPLPPLALDIFFTFNIAISIIVMLVAINVMKPGRPGPAA